MKPGDEIIFNGIVYVITRIYNGEIYVQKVRDLKRLKALKKRGITIYLSFTFCLVGQPRRSNFYTNP